MSKMFLYIRNILTKKISLFYVITYFSIIYYTYKILKNIKEVENILYIFDILYIRSAPTVSAVKDCQRCQRCHQKLSANERTFLRKNIFLPKIYLFFAYMRIFAPASLLFHFFSLQLRRTHKIVNNAQKK